MSYLDTRDLAKRLEELQDMRDAYLESLGSPMEEADLDDAEQEELAELETMESEISEWHSGETLIPESDFADYARELATDIGSVDPDALDSWPLTCIDWERAAEELKTDYTEVEYQGTTYLARSV